MLGVSLLYKLSRPSRIVCRGVLRDAVSAAQAPTNVADKSRKGQTRCSRGWTASCSVRRGTNGIVNVVRATIPVSVHNLRHGRGHFCHTSSTKRIGSGGDRRHDWVSISPTSGTETYNSSHHVSITARITSPDEIGHACLRIMAH
jgi:hypothetical protein